MESHKSHVPKHQSENKEMDNTRIKQETPETNHRIRLSNFLFLFLKPTCFCPTQGPCPEAQSLEDVCDDDGKWRGGRKVQALPVIWVPSGKHTKNYRKSHFLIGKSTVNGHFQ
jgi:hypothetical protein